MDTTNFKTGIVSISGNPNVGKSTLLNRIIGQKLSIVSNKPQTTRGVFKGIYNRDSVQIVFVDNPGFVKPRNKLDQFMFKQARASLGNADLVYLVVEPVIPDQQKFKTFIKQIQHEKKSPVILVINKMDILIDKSFLLPIIETYNKLFPFKQIVPISAREAQNIQQLIDCTIDLLPVADPLFSQDIVSNQYEKYFVAEMIREKVFHFTHQEIPYSVAVKIDEFKEREVGKWYIRATLIVEKSNHKGMIIGKQGRMIKKIGQSARKDIETFLDVPCFVELFVKVIANWKESDFHLRELGYHIQ